MTNNIAYTNKFSKLLRKKQKEGSLRYLLKKIEEAITLLKESDNPQALGERKEGELKGLYAYTLNDSSRILYTVDKKEGIFEITLLRVCDHKQAYGSD
jgi:addiction module RelE/StbE family toxin